MKTRLIYLACTLSLLLFMEAKGQIALSDSSKVPDMKNVLYPGTYRFTAASPIYGFYYKYDFPPALPPMILGKSLPTKAMGVDSTFILRPDSLYHFSRKGLYLLQTDTSSMEATTFRMEETHYPKFIQLETLAEALVYITTKAEYDTLSHIKGDKRAFDRFLLNLTNSPERAKHIVRNYFGQAEKANALFTTYKEGWKTDMGMIYTICGVPNEITRKGEEQEWKYDLGPRQPSLRFTFIRTPSIFSSSHYVLIREKKYTNTWYLIVDLWRKGRF